MKNFTLPSTKINHFALQDNTNLLRLAELSSCKFHNRIWRMKAFFLLSRWAEKRIALEEEDKIVQKYLGKKFNDKINMSLLRSIVNRPKLTEVAQK